MCRNGFLTFQLNSSRQKFLISFSDIQKWFFGENDTPRTQITHTFHIFATNNGYWTDLYQFCKSADKFQFFGIFLIGRIMVNTAYYIFYIKKANFQELSFIARPILREKNLYILHSWSLSNKKTLRKLGVMYLLRKIFSLTCWHGKNTKKWQVKSEYE